MKRPMLGSVTQLLLGLRSRFTRRARLEAENLILRHQLIVLRRKSPARVRLWNIVRHHASRRLNVASHIFVNLKLPRTGASFEPRTRSQQIV